MKSQYIYFVDAIDVGLIKIGIAEDVEKRLQTLRAYSPVRLILLGAINGALSGERYLHDHFAHVLDHSEWFSADVVRPTVDALIAGTLTLGQLRDRHGTYGHLATKVRRALREAAS